MKRYVDADSAAVPRCIGRRRVVAYPLSKQYCGQTTVDAPTFSESTRIRVCFRRLAKCPAHRGLLAFFGSGASNATLTLVDLEALVSLIHTRKALPRRGARGATTSAGNRVTRLRVAGVVERREVPRVARCVVVNRGHPKSGSRKRLVLRQAIRSRCGEGLNVPDDAPEKVTMMLEQPRRDLFRDRGQKRCGKASLKQVVVAASVTVIRLCRKRLARTITEYQLDIPGRLARKVRNSVAVFQNRAAFVPLGI